jgi:hypothetical protein
MRGVNMVKITWEDLKIFFKYIGEEVVDTIKGFGTAIISIPGTLWHNLNRPKFWFYVIFVVFLARFVFFRTWSQWTDKLVLLALVIIILWKEYDDGTWKSKWREEEKKRIFMMINKQKEKANEQQKKEE